MWKYRYLPIAVPFLLIPMLVTAADAPAPNGVEVLARGPVHEGYAEPAEQKPAPGAIAPKQPPAPVDELPPDQKPEGDNVIWLPGYWAWDEDRTDFIWVSGFWRVPPPNRIWMPGSWRKAENGYQWVSGLWAPATDEKAELQYLPEPPAPLDFGATTPAPNDTSIYVPGNWVWRDRYVYRPGYWMDYRPGWIWIPAHYRWTPVGYIFVDGYWDYPLDDRGTLFAPVYIPQPVYEAPAYCWTPSIVVREECMFGSLFVRRGCGYYFGDYFDAGYANSGFTAWVGYSRGRDVFGVRGWYDPMLSYYRVHHRRDPYWGGGINEQYIGRYRGDIPAPPRTLVQQNTIINNNVNVRNNTTIINNRTVNVGQVQMLARLDQNNGRRLQAVPEEARQEQVRSARQVNALAQQRNQRETQLLAKDPAQPRPNAAPRTVQLDVPKPVAVRVPSADPRPNSPNAKLDGPKLPAPVEPKKSFDPPPQPRPVIANPNPVTPKINPQPNVPTPKGEPKINGQPPKVEPKINVQPNVPTPKVEPKINVQPNVPTPKVEPKVNVQPPTPAPKVEPKVNVQPPVVPQPKNVVIPPPTPKPPVATPPAAPVPQPKPPVTMPQPSPVPQPKPNIVTPQPAPQPKPVFTPPPAPAPQPKPNIVVPQPAPQPKPVFTPPPAPRPAPAPAPAPQVRPPTPPPAPKPVFTPPPAPRPAPAPAPQVRPPTPAPAPRPVIAPPPAPRPAPPPPQVRPPAPAPAPKAVVAPPPAPRPAPPANVPPPKKKDK